MISRSLLNWLMVVALLLLGWFVYQSLESSNEAEPERLSALDPTTVNELQLQRGDEVLRFERRDQRWFMVQPQTFELKAGLAKRLLAAFGLQSQQRYPIAGAELAKYGLQHPPVRLAADGVELIFGRINPLSSQRYVQVGETLHMVAENDISFLQQSWWRFAALRLLPEGAEVELLRIEGLGELRRGAEGWQYQGDQPPTSADQMQALVDRWHLAQALELQPAAEQPAGVAIDVVLAGGERLEFVLAKQADEWWLWRPAVGLVYRMADESQLWQWPEVVGVERE